MSRKIRIARKNGFSTIIAVTGYANTGEKYRIERIDDNSFRFTKADETEKAKGGNIQS